MNIRSKTIISKCNKTIMNIRSKTITMVFAYVIVF